MNALRLATLLLLSGALCAPAQTPSATPAQPAHPAAAKKTWFVRLIPPRPTFATDMTEDEGKLMEAHYEYWKGQFEKHVCLFGGPVLDPKGAYGVLAIVAATEDEARAIAGADPSVKAGLNKIEVAEMKIAFLPRSSTSGSGE